MRALLFGALLGLALAFTPLLAVVTAITSGCGEVTHPLVIAFVLGLAARPGLAGLFRSAAKKVTAA